MSQQERYDNILFGLAQEHSGGALEFLDTVLSFFARKTDFFTGGGEDKAREILNEKFEKLEINDIEAIFCDSIIKEFTIKLKELKYIINNNLIKINKNCLTVFSKKSPASLGGG